MSETRGVLQEAVQQHLAQIRQNARRYVPVLEWGATYARENLRTDVIGGITVWGVMTPTAMAYSQMAGLPPQHGLYAAMAGLFAYALLATSRHVRVTASSTIAVMSASIVLPLGGGDTDQIIALSSMLALLVGIGLIFASLLRLGFIADFLSKSIIAGFVFGVAVTIIVGQLPKILGVPGGSGNVFDQISQLIQNLYATNWYTVAVSVGTMAVLVLLKRFAPRVPGGLVALALGILAATYFNLAQYGVAYVGEIPRGLPAFGFPRVSSPADIAALAAGAMGIIFLATGETIGVARSFASKYRYPIDTNQELMAIGAANILSGFSQGFAVDASLSTTATADDSGSKTQVSALVTVGMVVFTLLVLAPFFQNLPNAVLAVIVIRSVWVLLDVAGLRHMYEMRRTDFLLAITALMGVLLAGVLTGLLVAVFLALLMVLYRASRPYVAQLAELPYQPGAYADIARHPDGHLVPGLLIVRLDAPLYYFNASVASQQIRALVTDQAANLRGVVFDLGATADLDITSGDILQELITDLREQGLLLLLVQVRGPVRDRLRRLNLMEKIGEQHIHFNVHSAVLDFQQIQQAMGEETAVANQLQEVPDAL